MQKVNPGIRQKILGAVKLGRPLKLVWDSARGWTIASLVLMIIQALLPLAVLYLIKLTVDAVASGIDSPDKIAALKEVLLLILVTGLVTLAISPLSPGSPACRSAVPLLPPSGVS